MHSILKIYIESDIQYSEGFLEELMNNKKIIDNPSLEFIQTLQISFSNFNYEMGHLYRNLYMRYFKH